MKIIDVEAYPISVPFKKGGPVEGARIGSVTPVIVKVITDEGITGVGEAFGFFGSAAITAKVVELMLKPLLAGKDPMQVQMLWDHLYRKTYYCGRMGVVIAAISGVEMALWDIKGKATNTPVFQMLGGRTHDTLPAYASMPHYYEVEDELRACTALLQEGYTAVKLHETKIEAIAETRAIAGDNIKIMLDVNCEWDVTTAIAMGRAFEQYNLFWLEEPVWPPDDYRGLAEVRAAIQIPLASGENEYTSRGFSDLITNRGVDFVQPSVFKLGGILQDKNVFALAQCFGVKVAPHCWSFGPAAAATLHVCFSELNYSIIETSIGTLEADILSKPLRPEKGLWKVPEGPGLGVELDEATLMKYRM